MTQAEAFDILKMGHNVYLTGSAGSGKTFLLNKYIRFLKSRGVGVGITASTGIASTHLGGITIHSWSGIGVSDTLDAGEMDKLLKKHRLIKRFENTRVLIVDEISMLHPHQMDLVNQVCQAFKQSLQPFGGMQIVLSGDFFQLPPVKPSSSETSFANQSAIWNSMDLKVCYLREQHRHSSDGLIEILNDIRGDNVSDSTYDYLNERMFENLAEGDRSAMLYTHNVDVDYLNNNFLKKLKGEAKVYSMEETGTRRVVELLKKGCLAPEALELKTGAAVMFVKNNFEEGYVNGTMGTVVGFDSGDLPIVETKDGNEIIVDRESWKLEEEGRMIAEIFQLPLRLAWAITVHKSQGMTLDAVEVDLSKSFVEGMGYVALSRARTLSGLILRGLNEISLKVSQAALEIDCHLQQESEQNAKELNNLSRGEKAELQKKYINSIASEGRKLKEKKLNTYEKTRALVKKQLSIEEMAKERGFVADTILNHLEKLKQDGVELDLEYLKIGVPPERLNRIYNAFKKSGDTKLTPVKEMLGDGYSFDELKVARLFL